MGTLFKSIGGIFDGVFGAVEAPSLPQVQPLEEVETPAGPTDDQIAEATRRTQQAARRRAGRQSTILTTGEDQNDEKSKTLG